MKFLEENIGGKLLDIRLGEDFLSRTRKTKARKAKPNGVTANEEAPAQQRPPPGTDEAAAGERTQQRQPPGTDEAAAGGENITKAAAGERQGSLRRRENYCKSSVW